MSEQYVFYQGEIIKEEEVQVSIRSRVFNYGLGCFEGIRAYWNDEEEQLYGLCLVEHYERLLTSSKILFMDIPYSAEELAEQTVELLKKNNCRGTTYIRPVVYKGKEGLNPTLHEDDDNRIVIYTQPLGSFIGKDVLSVAVTSWRRISDTMLPPRTKAIAGYLNSALATSEVRLNGFDEAIFLTDKGYVCEGPGENIFLVKNGKLITPTSSDDILEGITRNLIMELAEKELGIEVIERSVGRTELYNSDEVFFTGTAMEVTSVVEIDRRKIGTGEKGEITKKLDKLYTEIILGKNEDYLDLLTPVY